MIFRNLFTGRARPAASVSSVLAAATVVALVAAGCGSNGVGAAVRANALTVNGTSVSRTDFEHDISALSASSKLKALDKQVATQNGSASSLFDKTGKATRVLTTSWLNRIANQIIVDQKFKALHLKVTSSDVTEGKSQFSQLFATQSSSGAAVSGDPIVAQFPKWFQTQEDNREARLVALTTALDAKQTITPAQEHAFYKQNVGSICPSGFNVAHILLKTLPEAQAVEAQLAAGAKFADLAKSKSIDTGSAANGGSLGCFATGQFVAEFETGFEKAKVNVPTAPVHSQFGYHIILKTKFVPPTFAALEPQIRQQLLSQLGLVQKYVSSALKTARVHVDELYGSWDTKSLQIVPPKVPAVRSTRKPAATTTTKPAATPTT
jgi:parvulin-like peptidyl-prolyl isomerase